MKNVDVAPSLLSEAAAQTRMYKLAEVQNNIRELEARLDEWYDATWTERFSLLKAHPGLRLGRKESS